MENPGKVKNKPEPIKWRGAFNYSHSIEILYCYSSTERGAWRNFMFRLAKKHGVEIWHCMQLFGGCADNYSITKEVSHALQNL